MSEKSVEEVLISIIKDAIPKVRNIQNEFTPKYKKLFGFGLGHLLTYLLKLEKSNKFRGKWIDDVEWKSLVLVDKNNLKGRGLLWWGPKKDYSKLYSENFYAEFTIETFDAKSFKSYLFRFQIDGGNFEFKK